VNSHRRHQQSNSAADDDQDDDQDDDHEEYEDVDCESPSTSRDCFQERTTIPPSRNRTTVSVSTDTNHATAHSAPAATTLSTMSSTSVSARKSVPLFNSQLNQEISLMAPMQSLSMAVAPRIQAHSARNHAQTYSQTHTHVPQGYYQYPNTSFAFGASQDANMMRMTQQQQQHYMMMTHKQQQQRFATAAQSQPNLRRVPPQSQHQGQVVVLAPATPSPPTATSASAAVNLSGDLRVPPPRMSASKTQMSATPVARFG
jgi:hypothetical protein